MGGGSEERWTTKGGGRPPLPVAFFDLNGDGRQETLIANDDATVGIYDGSERRTSSSTLEKMLMRSDTSRTDVVVVVVCDETPRAIFAPRWKW